MAKGSKKGDDPTVLTGGFLQGSGNGVGPQILVRADHMSTEVAPQDTYHITPSTGKRTALSTLGLQQEILNNGAPRYKAALDKANKYRKSRMKELARLHGYVSSGAGALLASASLALAASRFLYEAYAADSATDDGGNPAMLQQAAKLADSARQHELAAWELASREGVLRRRQDMATSGTPWLETKDGEKSRKGGRPTKREVVQRTLEECPVEPPLVDSYKEEGDG